MLSSSAMSQSLEKNFTIFISLMLEGAAAGLIFIPGYLGLKEGTISYLMAGILGAICFITALSLQIASIWRSSHVRFFILQGFGLFLLAVLTWLFWRGEQYITSEAFAICGIFLLIALLSWHKLHKQLNFFRLTIAVITFVAGITLVVSTPAASELQAEMFKPLIAVIFLITAFMGIVAVVLPSFRHDGLFTKSQMLPWLAWGLVYMIAARDGNLIVPAAVITMLVLERNIPWNRLLVLQEDILSRRVIMIAFTVEVALLIFLGALLYLIDPDTGSNLIHHMTLRARVASVVFFIILSIMNYYITSTVIMTINGLILGLAHSDEELEDALTASEEESHSWNNRLIRYIKPFMLTQEDTRIRLNAQEDQINILARQSNLEKKKNAQLTLLLELSQQLENQLDQPVSAQLAVNTLERVLNCSLATLYIHEPDKKDFMLIAAAGRNISLIPSGYRQEATTGVIGRAFRQRKTQVIGDIQTDSDYIKFEGETHLSALIIPLIFNGHINGMLSLHSENANAFGSIDVGMAESVAAELVRAWERSGYHQRLKELLQTGSQLSSTLDPEATAREVALISRNIVQAKFTFVYIQLGQERNYIHSASSGEAPQLLRSLKDPDISQDLFNLALHASQPFRIRDIRKYEKTFTLQIDGSGLRSLLTIPIRLHHVNIGAIFVFGKMNEVFFTENDESLAELISIQASGAFESAWLQQELRSSLRITSLLYRLSNQIIQSENIEDAASDIAQTAHKLAKNTATGIVLLDLDNSIIAQVQIDDTGVHASYDHPMNLVLDAMNSGQMIYFSQGESTLRTCLPIQTPIRKYGAIWMDAPDDPAHNPSTNPNDLQALVNQAAIALERSLLLVESRRQAAEIKVAYDTLEATYDQTLASLSSALDARDRETEGHSMRVTDFAKRLGEKLGYSAEQLKILERGSLLHDIGKIGVSDTILHKPGPLDKAEWDVMKLHPNIGARIVAGIPFLEDTIPLILHHQERWDGTGYPGGLKGEEIPLLARLFSVIDAFDALTSNRPYRQKITPQEALEYLKSEAGILFDPHIVDSFSEMIQADLTSQSAD